MSWPRQGSQNPLDNREFEWKTWISWVWGFEVVHAVKGSFEVALPPNASVLLETNEQCFPFLLESNGPSVCQPSLLPAREGSNQDRL